MTTFRYTTIWRVTTVTGLVYRVVTDSNGIDHTLGDIRELVLRTMHGFDERAMTAMRYYDMPQRYVADSKLHPTGPVEVTSVVQPN